MQMPLLPNFSIYKNIFARYGIYIVFLKTYCNKAYD